MENYLFDLSYLNGKKYLAGIDEAGRGPLAGPVTASAVILDLNDPIFNLDDSKKLSEKQRNYLYKKIIDNALCFAITFIDNNIIDEINIYQAAKLAMIKSLEKLSIEPDVIITDAMPLTFRDANVFPVKKGDTLSASVMAASILAKVARDRYMTDIEQKYPGYGFIKHKGYPTKAHREAIKKLGTCEIHRKSFRLL